MLGYNLLHSLIWSQLGKIVSKRNGLIIFKIQHHAPNKRFSQSIIQKGTKNKKSLSWNKC